VKGGLPVLNFEPLDKAAYDRQRMLLKALSCAHPVCYQGKNLFVQELTARQDGGRIQMTVYLTGNPTPIDSSEIELTRSTT
jgi:hypothetical protein